MFEETVNRGIDNVMAKRKSTTGYS